MNEIQPTTLVPIPGDVVAAYRALAGIATAVGQFGLLRRSQARHKENLFVVEVHPATFLL